MWLHTYRTYRTYTLYSYTIHNDTIQWYDTYLVELSAGVFNHTTGLSYRCTQFDMSYTRHVASLRLQLLHWVSLIHTLDPIFPNSPELPCLNWQLLQGYKLQVAFEWFSNLDYWSVNALAAFPHSQPYTDRWRLRGACLTSVHQHLQLSDSCVITQESSERTEERTFRPRPHSGGKQGTHHTTV